MPLKLIAADAISVISYSSARRILNTFCIIVDTHTHCSAKSRPDPWALTYNPSRSRFRVHFPTQMQVRLQSQGSREVPAAVPLPGVDPGGQLRVLHCRQLCGAAALHDPHGRFPAGAGPLWSTRSLVTPVCAPACFVHYACFCIFHSLCIVYNSTFYHMIVCSPCHSPVSRSPVACTLQLLASAGIAVCNQAT